MLTTVAAVTATTGLKFTALGKGTVLIRNTGTNPAYIGAAGVADTDGFSLATTDEPVRIPVQRGEVIHAVCSTAETATLEFAWSK